MQNIRLIRPSFGCIIALALVMTAATTSRAQGKAQTAITPVEARAIAKEAYVYGFPLVDSYRLQYA